MASSETATVEKQVANEEASDTNATTTTITTTTIETTEIKTAKIENGEVEETPTQVVPTSSEVKEAEKKVGETLAEVVKDKEIEQEKDEKVVENAEQKPGEEKDFEEIKEGKLYKRSGVETTTTTTTTVTATATIADVETESDFEKQNKVLFTTIAHATQTGKGLLFYYKSLKSQNRLQPQGIINLADIVEVNTSPSVNRSFAFSIKTKNREYFFNAESDKAMKDWVKTIELKSEEAKKLVTELYNTQGFKEVYNQLVDRKEPFSGKKIDGVGSGTELMSSGDEIEGPEASESTTTPVQKTPTEQKRKTFPFNFISGVKKMTETEETTKEPTGETTTEVVTPIITTITEEKPKEPEKSPDGRKGKGGFFSFIPKTKEGEVREKNEEESRSDEEVVAETSSVAAAAAAAEELKKEEKHEEKHEEKRDGILKTLGKKIIDSLPGKEQQTTETAKTETVTPTENTEVTDDAVVTETTAETTPEAHKKEENSIFNIFSKKKGKEENKAETQKSETEEAGVKVEGEETAQKVEGEVKAASSSSAHKKKPSFSFFSKKSEVKSDTEEEHKKEDDTALEKTPEETAPEKDEDNLPKKEPLARRLTQKFLSKPKPPTETKVVETPTETIEGETTNTAVETANADEGNESQEAAESSADPKGIQSIFKNEATHEKEVTSGSTESREIAAVPESTTEDNAKASTEPKVAKSEETENEKNEKLIKKKAEGSVKDGYLQKHAQFFKNLQSRYFIFSKEGTLTYFNVERPETPKTVKIDRGVVIEKTNDHRQVSFEIKTKTRDYSLVAKTKEERDEWVNVLQEYQKSLPEESSSSSNVKDSVATLEVAPPTEENELVESVEEAAKRVQNESNVENNEADVETKEADIETKEADVTLPAAASSSNQAGVESTEIVDEKEKIASSS
ncbi:10618_t:CDS:2 [Ambispora gerdemannii]|uniref:10618_t:CDS:1 n=1 Tax=Ambispora gerdemannii TaxID=144530 RepID=A0A9N9CD75_9GLOM|nr:10618_t:CDS:2 [Ambispora gerdemannii]